MVELVTNGGHEVCHREIVPDEPAQIGPLLKELADPDGTDGPHGCADDAGFQRRNSSGDGKAIRACVGILTTKSTGDANR